MLERKVFCWDLDHTLGNFYNIASGQISSNFSESLDPATLGVRFGTHELLKKLCAQECKHFLTTSGSKTYAQRVLRLTGLDLYFEDILDRDIVDVGVGKKYIDVVKKLGITEDQARQVMMIIGDITYDQPVDINLVFTQNPAGYKYDIALLEEIFETVNKYGNGDFTKGFDRLYISALKNRNLVTLPSLSLVMFDYRTIKNNRFNITGPVIQVVNADKYLKITG